MSHKKKYALVGSGAGAVTGVVVSKNRVKVESFAVLLEEVQDKDQQFDDRANFGPHGPIIELSAMKLLFLYIRLFHHC